MLATHISSCARKKLRSDRQEAFSRHKSFWSKKIKQFQPYFQSKGMSNDKSQMTSVMTLMRHMKQKSMPL